MVLVRKSMPCSFALSPSIPSSPAPSTTTLTAPQFAVPMLELDPACILIMLLVVDLVLQVTQVVLPPRGATRDANRYEAVVK